MEILISGASTGIGRAAAVHFARSGHSVWAGVRTARALDDLKKMNVRGVQPLILDVTKSASIADALSVVRKHAGVLHALINNAGQVVGGPIEALEMAAWREQFDTNFFGLIELTKACLPSLRESKGRIINMSSVSGRIVSPFMVPYAASKFAVEAFSDGLRRELRPYGVKVCIVEPGAIKTPIWKKSLAIAEEQKAEYPPEIASLYGQRLDDFAKAMEKTEQRAAPVALVIAALQHALFAREPRTRYPVGPGIRMMTLAANILPDRGLDRILRSWR